MASPFAPCYPCDSRVSNRDGGAFDFRPPHFWGAPETVASCDRECKLIGGVRRAPRPLSTALARTCQYAAQQMSLANLISAERSAAPAVCANIMVGDSVAPSPGNYR